MTTTTIMAFGDSLTWGTDAAGLGRHPFEDRWPNVLAADLGPSYRVIEEGLGGRTTVFDDLSALPDRNGARTLPVMLESHAPLDLVIIMLGANDLKPHICGSPIGAAGGMRRLAEIVRTFPLKWGMSVPHVMLVSPPHFRCKADGSGPEAGRRIEDSERLAPLYRAVAAEQGAAFFDAATVSCASDVDGVHLDIPNTRAIGRALASEVRRF